LNYSAIVTVDNFRQTTRSEEKASTDARTPAVGSSVTLAGSARTAAQHKPQIYLHIKKSHISLSLK
jgi:hypothetical protein